MNNNLISISDIEYLKYINKDVIKIEIDIKNLLLVNAIINKIKYNFLINNSFFKLDFVKNL